jgi:hypothetical protein
MQHEKPSSTKTALESMSDFWQWRLLGPAYTDLMHVMYGGAVCLDPVKCNHDDTPAPLIPSAHGWTVSLMDSMARAVGSLGYLTTVMYGQMGYKTAESFHFRPPAASTTNASSSWELYSAGKHALMNGVQYFHETVYYSEHASRKICRYRYGVRSKPRCTFCSLNIQF